MLHDLYLLFVIGLVKAAAQCPSLNQKDLFVKTVAFTAHRLSTEKRRQTENALCLVFKLSKAHIRRIARQSFYEFWQDIFSLLPSNTKEELIEQTRLSGIEHLRSAMDNGKGAILWESSYFGRRNLAKQILHQKGFAVDQIHGENHLGGFYSGSPPSWLRYRIIKPFFERLERRFVAEIIYLPVSDSLAFTRILLERLKQNAILCLAADGRFGQKTITTKFLDHTAVFPTGAISLSKISGAPIMSLFCFEDGEGKTSMVIEPPLLLHADSDRESALEKCLAQYVSLLESYVRRYPEQYRNWHVISKSRNPESKHDAGGRFHI